MSFDRQIDQVCPHRVVEELLDLNFDQRTVRPLRPIASADSVAVHFNHSLTVPPEGVMAPARTYGRREGPFTVVRSVNDTLIVDISGYF